VDFLAQHGRIQELLAERDGTGRERLVPEVLHDDDLGMYLREYGSVTITVLDFCSFRQIVLGLFFLQADQRQPILLLDDAPFVGV
jgi:hypothetical protein